VRELADPVTRLDVERCALALLESLADPVYLGTPHVVLEDGREAQVWEDGTVAVDDGKPELVILGAFRVRP
jgi:hypothetical protein